MFKKRKIFSSLIVIKNLFFFRRARSSSNQTKLQKNSPLHNCTNAVHLLGLGRNLRAIEERQRQQYALLQEQKKLLQNLQNEIQSLKGIIEKMPNLPGAEPGREKISSAFYSAETEEDLDNLLERAVQVSSLSSLKK